MTYKNFTSLSPEDEKTFVVYEKTSVEAGKTAVRIGLISGVLIGILAVGVFVAIDPPKNAHAVEAPSELDEEVAPAKATPAAAEKEEPAAAEDDSAATPTTAPAVEGDSAATPTPPKGATKAPPTAFAK